MAAKKTKKSVMLLMRCNYNTENDDGSDVNFAYVTVTPKLVDTIVKAHAALMGLRAAIDEEFETAHAIKLWGGNVDFCEGIPAKGEIPDDYRVVKKLNPEDAVTRTECDQMTVTRERVYWSCHPKHSNLTVETEGIDIEALTALLK